MSQQYSCFCGTFGSMMLKVHDRHCDCAAKALQLCVYSLWDCCQNRQSGNCLHVNLVLTWICKTFVCVLGSTVVTEGAACG